MGNHADVKIDCSEIWVNVEIYESIYNNILTGSITINDSINMIRNAPIIGKETLEITFKTPSTEPIIKKFAVYDMSVKQRIPGKQDVIYTLQFASIQYLLDYRRKVSRAYKNTKISKIAERVFDDYLFDFSAEDEEVENAKIEATSDTGNPTTVVIPNWTPLQTMNWLASKAEYYGNCDYMFYETMEGFFFTPLSLLKTKNHKNYNSAGVLHIVAESRKRCGRDQRYDYGSLSIDQFLLALLMVKHDVHFGWG